MTKSQKAYAMAKAAHETAKSFYEKAIAALPIAEPTFEEQEGWELADYEAHPYYAAAQAIHDKYQVEALRKLVIEAERNMIESAQLAIIKRGGYSRVAPVFDKYFANEIYKMEMRDEFVNLCFTLRA